MVVLVSHANAHTTVHGRLLMVRRHQRGWKKAHIAAAMGLSPHCPWRNGKVERFNRTLQVEWTYRHVFLSNDERAQALTPWLETHNTRRRHTAPGGLPSFSRL